MATEKSEYGKRPLWQWIVSYLVIGGIIYAAIYFLFLNKPGGYNFGSQNSSPQQPNNRGY
jgi:hypothetical protein